MTPDMAGETPHGMILQHVYNITNGSWHDLSEFDLQVQILLILETPKLKA